MNWQEMKALRQWIREVNAEGVRFGHEEMAGTPDDPDPDYVELWREGKTPAEVIAADFGTQAPTA